MFDFFFADPHFGHAKIIDHAGRPFANVDEMDSEMERRYCAMVGWQDIVCWVGDVSFYDDARTAALLARLPGEKVLVRGNHDGTVARCLRLGFELVADELYLRIARFKVIVNHMPPAGGPDARYPERRPSKPGPDEFVLHGHTHEKQQRIGRRIHVGVDAWDFAPAPYVAIADLICSSR